ncbi:MAG: cyclic nucleotide-binding domain-containing protein [Bdellovibrionia bacterium]
MSAEKKSYKAGQILFNDGEASHSLFIIEKGGVSIRKKKGNASVEVGKVLKGEVIGELSFFDRQPRSATAVAITDVEVIEISFASMENIYASIPDYMKTIMGSLAARLRKANDTIRQLRNLPD